MPFLQTPEAEAPRNIFAAGPAQAYYMEPPEAASKPFVNQILWTADGSTLLIRRLVPPVGTDPLAIAAARQTDGLSGMMKLRPRLQLVAWSKKSRTSRTLLDLDSARAAFENLEPMAGSDRVLLYYGDTPLRPDGTPGPPRVACVLLSALTGVAVRLTAASDAQSDHARVELSPSRPLGAVLSERHTVALFGPDGKPGPELPLGTNHEFGFAADGGPGITIYGKDKRGKRTYEFHRMDPHTGAPGAVAAPYGSDERPVASMDGSPPAVGGGAPAEPAMTVAQVKPPQPEAGIYLHVKGGGPEELGLLSVGGELPILSPKNDAVAYILGNGAYVRSLVKVDRKAYDAALIEAERQKAMSTAKQVGTALAMYAADADDAFPMSDQKGSVDPYIRDRKMLDRFVYTFGGGVPTGGAPGMTEVGYVPGPGGRAVVYADGTVKWVPDGF